MKKIPICNPCKFPCMFRAKEVVLIDDTKECPYAGFMNSCRHPKGSDVFCPRFKTDAHGRILPNEKYPPPKNCPLEDAD